MGKIIFGTIALLVAVGFFVGIGVVIGSGWGAGEAGQDHTALVNACIDAHGGSVTKEQLAGCIDDARQGS